MLRTEVQETLNTSDDSPRVNWIRVRAPVMSSEREEKSWHECPSGVTVGDSAVVLSLYGDTPGGLRPPVLGLRGADRVPPVRLRALAAFTAGLGVRFIERATGQ